MAAALLLLILIGESHGQSIPAEITVNARVNTGPVSGDADDPAIWIHPDDPALSVVIGTDKVGNFVYVWNMNGQQLQRISVLDTPNNGDVRYGMEVGGAPVDIYVVGAEKASRVVVFKIDPATRTLSGITTAGGIPTPQVKDPYGVCLYRRASDGAMFVFVNSNGGVDGVLNQYRLLDDGAGRVKGTFVRAFGGDVNGDHSEGMVADDQLGYVYISQEDCCVHKFYADPDQGNQRLALFAQGDGIDPDREGLGIYACANGTGYLLLSSQGNKRVKVYRREGDPGNPHSHTLLTTIYTPQVGGTDGLDVTNRPAGPNFPFGFLAKHNSSAKNFALIAWEDIAKNYMTICTDATPCEVSAGFSADAISGCAPLAVNFIDQTTGPATSWSWDFGDGNTSTAQHPAHSYAAAGTYAVKLTATSESCSDTESKTDYITVYAVPSAAFAAHALAGNAPFTVNFTDQSTNVPTSWLWDFGDGGTATARNPSHQYVAPGTYTVTLTATNACGVDSEAKTNYITVNSAPANLALNKPATASSTNGSNAPGRAVDASTSTYWRSGSLSSSTVAWLRVDLQAPQNLGRVVVNWRGSYYARRYQIQVSQNGTSWSDVFSTTSGNGGVDNITFTAVSARYVRLYMTRNNESSERVNEFEVYAPGAFMNTLPQGAAEFGESEVAADFVLGPGHPNPFNPATQISYAVPVATWVRLKVYNIAGQQVEVLVDRLHEPGNFDVTFDAAGLPSGVYFSVLQASGVKRVQRLLLMK